MFVYRLDVLDALRDSGYNTSRLRREKLLGENAIQSLRHGDMVGITALDKICALLDTQPGNIIKYVPASSRLDADGAGSLSAAGMQPVATGGQQPQGISGSQ